MFTLCRQGGRRMSGRGCTGLFPSAAQGTGLAPRDLDSLQFPLANKLCKHWPKSPGAGKGLFTAREGYGAGGLRGHSSSC